MSISRWLGARTDLPPGGWPDGAGRGPLALARRWPRRVLEHHLATAVVCIVAVELVAIFLWFRPEVDTDFYDDIAVNLLDGHGYVTAQDGPPVFYITPGYILMLAGIFGIAGKSPMAVFVVQLALYLLFLRLLYVTAVKYASRRVAQWTVVATASYPLLSYYIYFYHPEILFTLGFGLFVWVALRAVTEPAASRSFCAGAALALCSLIKPFFFYYWPLFLLVAWRESADRPRRTRQAAAFVAGVLITVAPWTVRNYRSSGEFLLLATGGGFSLWVGNVLETDGLDADQLDAEGQRTFNRLLVSEIGTLGTAHTVANDRRLTRAALARMLADPRGTAELSARKALRLWSSPHRPEQRRYAPWFALFHVPLVLAALLTFARYEFSGRLVLLSLVAYFQLTYTVTSPTVRYVVPLVPYLILTAAWGGRMMAHAGIRHAS